jgi:membrane associated rhomboid family serine protease
VTRHQLLDASYVSLSGLIAAVGGAALLHGFRWARWIVVAWMAAHVVLSLFHSIFEVAIHTVLLVVLIYVLFRPQGSMSSTSQT